MVRTTHRPHDEILETFVIPSSALGLNWLGWSGQRCSGLTSPLVNFFWTVDRCPVAWPSFKIAVSEASVIFLLKGSESSFELAVMGRAALLVAQRHLLALPAAMDLSRRIAQPCVSWKTTRSQEPRERTDSHSPLNLLLW